MALLTRVGGDEARALLAAYGLVFEAIEPLPAHGTVNSNFRVRASGRVFFLRVNEGKRDEDVRAEAQLVGHLRARGVPTPEILAPLHLMQMHQNSPDDVMRVHQKPVTLFPWVAGREAQPALDGPSVRVAGQALALLHRAGQGLTPDQLPFNHYSSGELERRLASFAGDARLSAIAPALAEELAQARARDRGVIGLIHQDLFPDNLLVDEAGELTAILDLEQATSGPLLYDLAVALNAWCWDGAEIVTEAAEALLAAYAETGGPLGALALFSPQLVWEARLSAARFTITRITDVFLPEGVDEDLRRRKDWRDYARRLAYWKSQSR